MLCDRQSDVCKCVCIQCNNYHTLMHGNNIATCKSNNMILVMYIHTYMYTVKLVQIDSKYFNMCTCIANGSHKYNTHYNSSIYTLSTVVTAYTV